MIPLVNTFSAKNYGQHAATRMCNRIISDAFKEETDNDSSEEETVLDFLLFSIADIILYYSQRSCLKFVKYSYTKKAAAEQTVEYCNHWAAAGIHINKDFEGIQDQ